MKEDQEEFGVSLAGDAFSWFYGCSGLLVVGGGCGGTCPWCTESHYDDPERKSFLSFWTGTEELPEEGLAGPGCSRAGVSSSSSSTSSSSSASGSRSRSVQSAEVGDTTFSRGISAAPNARSPQVLATARAGRTRGSNSSSPQFSAFSRALNSLPNLGCQLPCAALRQGAKASAGVYAPPNEYDRIDTRPGLVGSILGGGGDA